MTEQWQELKETIIELRDNDGTATQQEVCKFLANLMDVLEKQMQELKTEKVIKMRDATPEEIELINKYIKSISNPIGVDFWDLEQQPCDDAISRQIISDYVESHIQEINTGYGDLNKHTNEILRMIVDYIEKMESVIPQPKTGHWYIDERPESDREIICSNCEQPIFKYHKMDFDYRPMYCPNCGARMVEPQEGKGVKE